MTAILASSARNGAEPAGSANTGGDMVNGWKEQCQYCGKRMKNIDEAVDHANNCAELKACPFCGGESEIEDWE